MHYENQSVWLVTIFDRLNTRDLLVRRHWRSDQEDNVCVLCPTHTYEDRLYLFSACNFSIRVWNNLQIDWSNGSEINNCIFQAKRTFGYPFFFEVMLTAAWCIWTIRNGKIFRGERATFGVWRSKFVHDISLLSYRVRDHIRPQLLEWIHNLPQFIIGKQVGSCTFLTLSQSSSLLCTYDFGPFFFE